MHEVWRGESPGNSPRPVRWSPWSSELSSQSIWSLLSSWVLMDEATVIAPITLAWREREREREREIFDDSSLSACHNVKTTIDKPTYYISSMTCCSQRKRVAQNMTITQSRIDMFYSCVALCYLYVGDPRQISRAGLGTFGLHVHDL